MNQIEKKRRRRRRKPNSWQIKRLNEFALFEQEEAKLYENHFERTSQKFSFKVLSVILFFLKEEFLRKPGSLIALFRIAKQGNSYCKDFCKRFERYYDVLQELNFL